jgi:hypothetical protein
MVDRKQREREIQEGARDAILPRTHLSDYFLQLGPTS